MQFMFMFANKAIINQDKRLGTTTVDDLDKLHRMDTVYTVSQYCDEVALCMCAVRCPPRQESLQFYDWLLLSHQTSFT